LLEDIPAHGALRQLNRLSALCQIMAKKESLEYHKVTGYVTSK